MFWSMYYLCGPFLRFVLVCALQLLLVTWYELPASILLSMLLKCVLCVLAPLYAFLRIWISIVYVYIKVFVYYKWQIFSISLLESKKREWNKKLQNCWTKKKTHTDSDVPNTECTKYRKGAMTHSSLWVYLS